MNVKHARSCLRSGTVAYLTTWCWSSKPGEEEQLGSRELVYLKRNATPRVVTTKRSRGELEEPVATQMRRGVERPTAVCPC